MGLSGCVHCACCVNDCDTHSVIFVNLLHQLATIYLAVLDIMSEFIPIAYIYSPEYKWQLYTTGPYVAVNNHKWFYIDVHVFVQ